MRIDLDRVFEGRLSSGLAGPLVVGFSGGGDSLALLLLVKDWADRHGRGVLAVTVDHRLRPEGAAWACWCRARAQALGARHRTLVWDGPKPATGLAAAARDARHRLLADVARAEGAVVVLLGHTADDRAECEIMQEEGSNVRIPRAWTPSPVWPEGRGVFVFRPLLDCRRATLRQYLVSRGETWIEDPANVDARSHRARARERMADSDWSVEPAMGRGAAGRPLAWADVEEGPSGDLLAPRAAIAAMSAADLGAAVICAAGAQRPPRTAAAERLLSRIQSGATFVATLAGARIHAEPTRIHIVRDAGEKRDGPREAIDLPDGHWIAWEGRMEVRARTQGARLQRLSGHAARLPPALRRSLSTTPSATRPVLPLVTHEDGRWELPSVVPTAHVQVRGLARERLLAARGGIVNEQAATLMAKAAYPS